MSMFENRVFDRERPLVSGLDFVQSPELPVCASSPVYRSDAIEPPEDSSRNWTIYDNQAEDWGDALPIYKSPHVTRVAFQNIGCQEKYANGDKSKWNATAFLQGKQVVLL